MTNIDLLQSMDEEEMGPIGRCILITYGEYIGADSAICNMAEEAAALYVAYLRKAKGVQFPDTTTIAGPV